VRRARNAPHTKSCRRHVVCGHFRTNVRVETTPDTDTLWGPGTWLVTTCALPQCRAYLSHERVPPGHKTPGQIINEHIMQQNRAKMSRAE